MALSTAPKTTNFLSPLGAKFTIKKLPTVNFFVQRVAIPSLTVGEFPIGTPFSAKLQMPGDLVTFGDLVVTFRVDENMDNYIEIFNWIKSITRIDDFDDSKAWGNEASSPTSDDKVFSDGTLVVLNSAMNPNRYVRFTDMFPTSISDVPFDTTLSDVDYVETTATFKFRKFDIETTG
jgi:hypothetical protein|tara:strand:+ start:1284 stop:1814 length:531 start_codon:yes stop_codon:yes gene_type:complete